MESLTAVELILGLVAIGIGPGSGVYLFGRWAMRGLDSLRRDIREVTVELRGLNSTHTDLRERVSLTEHRVGALEGALAVFSAALHRKSED